MKLIILRHEERPNNSLFFTPLTENGKKNAEELKNKLQDNIDLIYSSPFLRVLQTIYPYCKKHNKTVNVENSFYEYCQPPDFNHNNHRHFISEYNKFEYYEYITNIINKKYKSSVFVSNIKYLEKEQDIQNRVFPFIYNLCKKYKNTNKTILIISHMSICNFIKKVFNKNIKIDGEFPMGSFEEIIINENWKGIDGFM